MRTETYLIEKHCRLETSVHAHVCAAVGSIVGYSLRVCEEEAAVVNGFAVVSLCCLCVKRQY